MSHHIWFISDTHFGHENILKFTDSNGNLIRGSKFSNVDEMDEYMIQQWNSVVRPEDKVYHLGDVLMDKKKFYLLARLNGHKRLVRGNHDIHPTKLYAEHFEEIHGCRVFNGLPDRLRIAATHVPIHPDCGSRWGLNVHGHLHQNNIMLGHKKDPRYYNVSVEQINYTPIPMEVLIDHCKEHGIT